MLKLRITKSFKKDYLLMRKRGYDISLLDNVVSRLLKGEKLEAKYKDHILKGKLRAYTNAIFFLTGFWFIG